MPTARHSPAMPLPTPDLDPPAPQTPPGKKTPHTGSADKPAVGRSSPLGRKTEKPASIQPAGPSGQKGDAQHQKRHTNK